MKSPNLASLHHCILASRSAALSFPGPASARPAKRTTRQNRICFMCVSSVGAQSVYEKSSDDETVGERGGPSGGIPRKEVRNVTVRSPFFLSACAGRGVISNPSPGSASQAVRAEGVSAGEASRIAVRRFCIIAFPRRWQVILRTQGDEVNHETPRVKRPAGSALASRVPARYLSWR